MRKKALFIVSILMVMDLFLIIIKVSDNSYALKDDNNEKSTTKEIAKKEYEVKTAEEVDNNKTDNVDMVSLDIPNDAVSVVNSEYRIPDNLLSDLNNTIASYGSGSSFLVVNLNNGMSFGYNIDNAYASGSTIKATYALYVYKLIAAKKASLDDTMSYQAKYYNKGTGLIKNSAYGTVYSVKDLLYNMIHESDNVAYLMLLDKYKWDGFNDMLDDMGAVELHLSNTSRWGKLSCRSSAIIWQEIYRFSKTSQEGAELFDLFLNAKYNYFKEILPDVSSASKSGFTEMVVHDTGIVMDEKNPYIIIILSNTGGSMNNAYAHVKNMFSKIAPIMQDYNNYQ